MCKICPKARKTVKNIQDSNSTIFYINGILGLTVIQIPCGRPWPKLSVLYVIAKTIIYGCLVWYAIKVLPLMTYTPSIMKAVFNVIIVVNIAINLICTILGLWNYRKLKEFCRKITLADETLEIFGIDPEYTATYQENLRIILIWGLITLAIAVTDIVVGYFVFRSVYNAFLKFFAFELPQIVNPIVELNFVIKVKILGKRFERLNALIQSVSTNALQPMVLKNDNKYQSILKKKQNKVDVKPNVYFKNRKNIELLLKTARQLHLDLCATARQVNDSCSKQMSLQMASIFLMFTGFSYDLYIIYNEPNFTLTFKMRYYIALGLWLVATSMRMLYVVRTAVNVVAESQKTSQLAHEIQISRSQHKLLDEVQQLSLQIMQHPLCFSASGLISLDFGYIRGFVGSVTTYLMILIQNQPDMAKAANTLTNDTFNETTANYTIVQ